MRLGIELLNRIDCDVPGEETRSKIMGDHLCRSCSDHLVYCGEQDASGYALKDAFKDAY